MPLILYQQGDANNCLFCAAANALHFLGWRDLAKVLYDESFAYTKCHFNIWRDMIARLNSHLCQDYTIKRLLSHFSTGSKRAKVDVVANPSPNIRLIQVCASDGFTSHAIATCGQLIFDGNEDYALQLSQENMDWCCGSEEDASPVTFVGVDRGYELEPRMYILSQRDSNFLEQRRHQSGPVFQALRKLGKIMKFRQISTRELLRYLSQRGPTARKGYPMNDCGDPYCGSALHCSHFDKDFFLSCAMVLFDRKYIWKKMPTEDPVKCKSRNIKIFISSQHYVLMAGIFAIGWCSDEMTLLSENTFDDYLLDMTTLEVYQLGSHNEGCHIEADTSHMYSTESFHPSKL